MPLPKVIAIVVTYNGSRWVQKCFSSLTRSEYPVEVIVVDNNSTDDTATVISSLFPAVTVIRNTTNAGFGGGNNQGIKIALEKDADFVFLLNQDAWVEPDAIGNLVRSFRQASDFGIISPLHFNGDGSKLDNAFENYLGKEYVVDDIVREGSGQIVESEFINAAAWMVSRDCLEKVGGFGYLFPQYGEDRDFIQRLHYYKMKLGVLSTARIFHDRPEKRFDFESADKIVWYYSIGAKVRLSDINNPWTSAYLSVLFWFFKDTVVFVFKGKIYAVQAFFNVIKEVFLASRNDIVGYRKKISAGTRKLFIS